MSVNRPCGSSFARFSRQRPSTTAASGESIVTSISEKLSVPIFARSEYLTRYLSRTVSQMIRQIRQRTPKVEELTLQPLVWRHLVRVNKVSMTWLQSCAKKTCCGRFALQFLEVFL